MPVIFYLDVMVTSPAAIASSLGLDAGFSSVPHRCSALIGSLACTACKCLAQFLWTRLFIRQRGFVFFFSWPPGCGVEINKII